MRPNQSYVIFFCFCLFCFGQLFISRSTWHWWAIKWNWKLTRKLLFACMSFIAPDPVWFCWVLLSRPPCVLFCRYIDLKNMRRLSQTTSWKNFTRDFLFSQCERDLNEMTSRSIPVRCASSRCRCSTSFRRVRETSGLSRHAHTLQANERRQTLTQRSKGNKEQTRTQSGRKGLCRWKCWTL